MIYLDHAAATPMRPEAADVMARVQAEVYGNPSSHHALGRGARGVLEDARETILRLLGGVATGPSRDRLVFTSGATEANHLAIRGLGESAVKGGQSPGTVHRSARDHASAVEASKRLVERGYRVHEVPLTPKGHPDWTSLGGIPAPPDSCDIFSTTIVCSQTGVIDEAVPCLGRLPGRRVHADATQALGLVEFDFRSLAADTCSLSAHKLGGPRGIGALLVRHGLEVSPLMAGSQESGLRGGTECVGLAAAFASAVEAAVLERQQEAVRIRDLRDAFETGIVRIARARGLEVEVVGGSAPRAPHISTIAFHNADRQAIVMAADCAGIACSTGSACASGSSQPSPALESMGLPPAVARGAVRFSFGRSSTTAEVEACVNGFDGILKNFVERGIIRGIDQRVCIPGPDR